MKIVAWVLLIAALVIGIIIPAISGHSGIVTVNGHTSSTWLIGLPLWQGVLAATLAVVSVIIMRRSK